MATSTTSNAATGKIGRETREVAEERRTWHLPQVSSDPLPTQHDNRPNDCTRHATYDVGFADHMFDARSLVFKTMGRTALPKALNEAGSCSATGAKRTASQQAVEVKIRGTPPAIRRGR